MNKSIKHGLYKTRLHRIKRGWTIEQALTISTLGTNRKVYKEA